MGIPTSSTKRKTAPQGFLAPFPLNFTQSSSRTIQTDAARIGSEMTAELYDYLTTRLPNKSPLWGDGKGIFQDGGIAVGVGGRDMPDARLCGTTFLDFDCDQQGFIVDEFYLFYGWGRPLAAVEG